MKHQKAVLHWHEESMNNRTLPREERFAVGQAVTAPPGVAGERGLCKVEARGQGGLKQSRAGQGEEMENLPTAARGEDRLAAGCGPEQGRVCAVS